MKLAKIWHLSDPSRRQGRGRQEDAGRPDAAVQAEAGQRRGGQGAGAVDAFFNAGYDIDDAVKLAKIWHVTTYQAKVEGGKKLLAGQTLPIKP